MEFDIRRKVQLFVYLLASQATRYNVSTRCTSLSISLWIVPWMIFTQFRGHLSEPHANAISSIRTAPTQLTFQPSSIAFCAVSSQITVRHRPVPIIHSTKRKEGKKFAKILPLFKFLRNSRRSHYYFRDKSCASAFDDGAHGIGAWKEAEAALPFSMAPNECQTTPIVDGWWWLLCCASFLHSSLVVLSGRFSVYDVMD